MRTKGSGANFIDLQGHRYGRWLVLRRTDHIKQVRWVCACVCGTIRDVGAHDLRSGRTNSCGCLVQDRAKENPRRVNRGAYVSWVGMKQRVSYPGHNEFHRYGGRGITADARWLISFEAFLADMGPRPDGFSLERRDNDGPYCKANCYWATKAQQSANTSRNVYVEHGGERLTLKQLASKLGCNYYTLHGAYRRRGLPLDEAIRRATCPFRHQRPQSA